MKSQKKAQEQFILTVLELKDMIESLDIEQLDNYQEDNFIKIIRQASNSFTAYSQSLISQILAEIQNSIVEKLKKIIGSTEPSFLLKKGLTVKNSNIRFFCTAPDLVAGKYALLFVHKATKKQYFHIADYNGKGVFQIDFKTDATAEKLIETKGAHTVYILSSLTPYLRSFVAAHQPNSVLLEAIAAGSIYPCAPQGQSQTSLTPGLNKSQSRILAEFTRLPQGAQMLKGPPGTGKTTTIVSILSVLCQQVVPGKKSDPILVCGPSNKSVSVIAQSFHKKFPTIPIVLCGHEETANSKINSLAEKEIHKAEIIFATLSKSGSSLITKAIKKVRVLIIDEAGQASEPDMLIPFQLKPNKALLVGDECQLPPTILSKNPEEYNHHWSMLSRLMTV